MKRRKPSAPACVAVAIVTVALAASIALAHEAGTNRRSAAQPVGGQVEQSAPLRPMDPAMIMPGGPRGGLLMPMMNPARGRKVFAAKGCVVCHAINGVGGNHGPELDMSRMGPMNPFEFAAKMWRGAEAMAVLQQEELGETIELTGQDLADIIAFVHSAEEVGRFSEADMPHKILDILKRTHGEEAGHAQEKGSAGHRTD